MTKHESQRAVHVLLVVKDTSLSVAFGRCVLWRVEHLDWGREAKEELEGIKRVYVPGRYASYEPQGHREVCT